MLTANTKITLSLPQGQVLTVTASEDTNVTRLPYPAGGEPYHPVTVSAASQEFGPYEDQANFLIECLSGTSEYSVGVKVVNNFNALTNYDLSPVATSITTGASPVDADPTVRLYDVTSGGSGGAEVINLLDPELDDNGANLGMAGARVFFRLVAKTDPADAITFIVGGQDFFYQVQGSAEYSPSQLGQLSLANVGQMVCFVWCGDYWYIDVAIVDFSPNYTGISESRFASENSIRFVAGNATEDGNQGFSINFQGGHGAGELGNGGDITFTPGSRGGFRSDGDLILNRGINGGSIKARNLPTSDPGIADALWNDNGVLKISAG
jgi:hypothetical protein